MPVLFALAHVCHMTPAQVDELGFPQFITLSSTADAYMEAEMKRPRF